MSLYDEVEPRMHGLMLSVEEQATRSISRTKPSVFRTASVKRLGAGNPSLYQALLFEACYYSCAGRSGGTILALSIPIFSKDVSCLYLAPNRRRRDVVPCTASMRFSKQATATMPSVLWAQEERTSVAGKHGIVHCAAPWKRDAAPRGV